MTISTPKEYAMRYRDFIIGLFIGCFIAIAAVVSHDKALDATPVYNSGYADGYAEGFKAAEEETNVLGAFDVNA